MSEIYHAVPEITTKQLQWQPGVKWHISQPLSGSGWRHTFGAKFEQHDVMSWTPPLTDDVLCCFKCICTKEPSRLTIWRTVTRPPLAPVRNNDFSAARKDTEKYDHSLEMSRVQYMQWSIQSCPETGTNVVKIEERKKRSPSLENNNIVHLWVWLRFQCKV